MHNFRCEEGGQILKTFRSDSPVEKRMYFVDRPIHPGTSLFIDGKIVFLFSQRTFLDFADEVSRIAKKYRCQRRPHEGF
jgi:hypothetical protein